MAHRLLLRWKKRNVFLIILLYILFLLAIIGAFTDFLVCMYVIFVLSTISFVIIRLSRHCCFIHYFETTDAAVVGNFIVCQCRTSCTRIYLWRYDATTFRFLKSVVLVHGTHNCLPFWRAFSNVPVFGYRFHGTRGDGRQKRKETCVFKGKLIHVDEAL